ncbi:MAG: ribonuclease R [Candidatus Vogelbacteria bacterium]|nr:ribonuclease R [Candidatus Vogelbacteria bacterium]
MQKTHIEKPKNKMISGRINHAGRKGGFFLAEGLEGRDNEVPIAPEYLNTALTGDRVEIENDKVIRILERARTQFAGTIKMEQEKIWLKPYDTKVPGDILVTPSAGAKLVDGERVVVEINHWDKLEGAVINRLGQAGDNETEIGTIMFEHKIQYDFPEAVTKEANEIARRSIPKEEVARRRDFRNILTFTIDPETAKDFDDALSYQLLPNGQIELGVHIADVSYFVRPESAIDNEAKERATSVYLVDRTIPMLPEVLSNGLCSLVPGEDRLTFSAIFVLDKSGRVHKRWFGKTIIHSKHRFTYDEVDTILETGMGPLAKELSDINDIAKNIRKERFEKGAISLDSDDVKFKLDPTGKPVGIVRTVPTDSHHLIEEYMLMANKYVAEFIFYKNSEKHGAGKHTFVYRVHDIPNQEKITELKTFLRNFDYKFEKGKVLTSKRLNDLILEAESKPEERLVKTSILRSMSKAIYSTKNIGHYGLAFTCYTHFTSPIRRYPDTMVHRLLYDYLEGKGSPDTEEYERLCAHSSAMERRAMEAEWASIKYKQVEYAQDKIGQVYTGIITGVTEWGFYVEAKETMCEGMVSLRNLKDDFYIFDKKNFCLFGKKTHKKFRLGDEVKIKILSADLERRTIDYILA